MFKKYLLSFWLVAIFAMPSMAVAGSPMLLAPSAAMLPLQTNISSQDELRGYLILKKRLVAANLFRLLRRGEVTLKMKELKMTEGEWYMPNLIKELGQELKVSYLLIGSLKRREAQLFKTKTSIYRIAVYDAKSGEKLVDENASGSIIRSLVSKNIGNAPVYRLNEAAGKMVKKLAKDVRRKKFKAAELQ